MAASAEQNALDYILEHLEDKAISFRRADMDKPQAREALRVLFGLLYQLTLTERDIDYILADVPADWPYIAVKPVAVDATSSGMRIEVSNADREPGRNSGNNPVITSIASYAMH